MPSGLDASYFARPVWRAPRGEVPRVDEVAASEPLTLEEEYAMQLSWQTDYDKLTFIACHPLPGPLSKIAKGHSTDEIIASQGYDVPEKMMGDVNLFLRVAYELDEEGVEMLDWPYVRGEIELMIASPSDRERGFGKATLLAFLQYIRNHTVEILDQYKSHLPDGPENHIQHQDMKIGGLVLVSKINKTNFKSRRLFEGAGFGQVGEEDYFGEIELKLAGGMDGVKPVATAGNDIGGKGHGIAVILTGCTILFARRYRNVPPSSTQNRTTAREKGSVNDQNALSTLPTILGPVDTLVDFDWKTTEPLKHRPFKPKYHLTMALEKTDVNNLIVMDKNYLDRVTLRRRVISEYPATVVGHLEGSRVAVKEIYEFLTDGLLPARWPQMFQRSNGQLNNLVTGYSLPISCPESSTEALAHIGSNLDEDFLILLPSDDGDSYTLKAFSTCFPSGWDASKKLGLKLRDIHGPVPKYMNILNKSMDRYFGALEVGKFKRRLNWSVMTNNELFTPFEITHFHNGKHTNADHPAGVEIENTYQRTEMQSLFRLPQSGAIVFTIKTYMYPIQEIKDEGYGEELATAIEGLETGNVPEMFFYKRGPIWGEYVKAFLRS
ncbi:hypothetical protein V493_01075 [Pseudogymnoascus sp. VKM F-4281 (FW-2241)]|nr:hypothetical protein V493_01075 [Pseudogymnoascus sp. VKM F-4281 (FW-2241)]